MDTRWSELDRKLCRILCEHPKKHNNRYTDAAERDLVEILFRALTNDRADYLEALLPDGFSSTTTTRLQEVQQSQDRTEYSASAAKGHACDHILRSGEVCYRCENCMVDDSSVLCAPCFNASDHEGHQFIVQSSPGNNGRCDCGDPESFRLPSKCALHTATEDPMTQDPRVCLLPEDLQRSISITIGRALDYFCDVISCSPENLRLPKTQESVKHGESTSRLSNKWYFPGDEHEADPEYCLVLWNDEKHTIDQVQHQLARACRESLKFGIIRATETNDIGRSVIRHSRNISELIKICQILEQIKITVTIRSSRDTYREQMCNTIVEWLNDIAGSSIRGDYQFFKHTICQQMIHDWWIGSEAPNAMVGRAGLFDNDKEDLEIERAIERRNRLLLTQHVLIAQQDITLDAFEDDEDDDDQDDEGDDEQLLDANELDGADGDEEDGEDEDDDEDEHVNANNRTPRRVAGRAIPSVAPRPGAPRPHATGVEVESSNEDLDGTEDDLDIDADFMDIDVSMQAGPTVELGLSPTQTPVIFTPAESEDGDVIMQQEQRDNETATPKIPDPTTSPEHDTTPAYWTEIPSEVSFERMDPLAASDSVERMRVDSLILFDMRLWKDLRIKLRNLLTGTIVSTSHYRRIFASRLSMMYTVLCQLYLVNDREPDHSIFHVSLHVLTIPSITIELVEKGNFLTTVLAALYTFLTTRQVGYPKDVDSQATLAFESGSVGNKRLFATFQDFRRLITSDFTQKQIRLDSRYLRQFLDLAKLVQGICPNTRAVGEHVEYETDAWINASLLTKEMNQLCRQFALSFCETGSKQTSSIGYTCDAIYDTACIAIVNSIGLERKRFDSNEIKEMTRFKEVKRFEFEIQHDKSAITDPYRIVDFVVQDGSLSFHHALHFTLSWLIEFGKSSHEALEALDNAGTRVVLDLQKVDKVPAASTFQEKDDALLAMFDYPLRVCAWLAQMKAGGSAGGGIWVRNGVSLRHQWTGYRAVAAREVGYQRDLLLLQTALVACDPGRVLATMIDRYGLENWMRGDFMSPVWCEDAQSVDMVEDFIFLLINLLSDRDNLILEDNEVDRQRAVLRKAIVHTLCFKPLSYSDLKLRLSEHYQRSQGLQELQDALKLMTNFRAPEGLHDVGMFELKPEFLKDLDPYNSNFSKNQRDEAEAIYRRWMAKTTGKAPEDVVLEPNLRPIKHGIFVHLTAVTRTPLFAQIIYYCLEYALEAPEYTPDVPQTRIETLLHVILQLCLVATVDDELEEIYDFPEDTISFVRMALNLGPQRPRAQRTAIITILQQLSNREEYGSCRPKIKHLLRQFVRKREFEFKNVTAHLEFPYGRLDTASPANLESELEAKKKQAQERKAKVMAQFQQQQQSFLDNQANVDWGEDDAGETETDTTSGSEKHTMKYPTSVCMHCREDVTADNRLYGAFAMIIKSGILRQTPLLFPDSYTATSQTSTFTNMFRDQETTQMITPLTDEDNRIITVLAMEMADALAPEELRAIMEESTSNSDQGLRSGTAARSEAQVLDPIVAYFREEATRKYQERMFETRQKRVRTSKYTSPDYVREVLESPANLDTALRDKQPFGVAGWNHERIVKMKASGEEIEVDRQNLGKGWPIKELADSRIMTSCGHVMHFACFTNYYASVQQRHVLQVARNHPERSSQLEFVCPLCKAAGNTFLPVTWTSVELSYPGKLLSESSLFDAILDATSGDPSAQQRDRWNKNLQMTQRMGAEFIDSRSGFPLVTSPRESLRSPTSNARNQETPGEMAMAELRKIFERFGRTLSISMHAGTPTDRKQFSVLLSSFANTIAATEIAHRGLASELGLTLLSKISPQTLLHLRLLASVVRVYPAVASSADSSVKNAIESVQRAHLFRLIFPALYPHAETPRAIAGEITPFLMQDSFTYLTEASMTLCHVTKFEPHHLLELCYTAELMRVIMAFQLAETEFISEPSAGEKAALFGITAEFEITAPEDIQGVSAFCEFLVESEKSWRAEVLNKHAGRDLVALSNTPFSLQQKQALVRAIRSYATAFLRKAAILFNIAHNVEFPASTSFDYIQQTELDRLSQLLGLQPIGLILSAFSPYSGKSPTESLANRWLAHYFEYSWLALRKNNPAISHVKWSGDVQDEVLDSSNKTPAKVNSVRNYSDLRAVEIYSRIPLLHPCTPELIGLPKHFDVLMEDLQRHRCPTTGKELTDPALCLFCGAFICAQAVCCRQDSRLGGCNRHMVEKKCGGGTIGMFLVVRKCMVVLLHLVPAVSTGGHASWQTNGSWFQAPYLTQYGEHDLGLRNKERLFLSQKRYDKLYRDAWLCVRGGSEIWSMIARRLEADMNHGGWETL